jgi:hypothetical protein
VNSTSIDLQGWSISTENKRQTCSLFQGIVFVPIAMQTWLWFLWYLLLSFFSFLSGIRTFVSPCQPQIVKAQETLSQSIQNLTFKALAHALGRAVLPLLLRIFFLLRRNMTSPSVVIPLPPHTHFPRMNTDLSTLFFLYCSFWVLPLGYIDDFS